MTWPGGLLPAEPWEFEHFVAVGRSAGGIDYTYDYGVAARQTLAVTFPDVDAATLAAFDNWRLTTVVGPRHSFLHQDYSQTPLVAKQVRLLSYRVVPEYHPDPAQPVYTVSAILREASS